MNSLNRIMSYDKNKIVNQVNCDCVELINVEVENQVVEYPPLTEEEIEQIIKERYDYKDEKTKTFIKKALRVHGDRYDYSNVVYVKSDEKVEIICRVEGHKPFPQKPSNHLQGQGCKICGLKKISNLKKLTTKKFIEKANALYGIGRYDYSKVNYIDSQTDVIIICHNHETPYEFPQTPNNHLNGHGCNLCAIENRANKDRLSLNEFIKQANEVHGMGTYDYSKVVYVNMNTEVIITCPIHDDFPQTPSNHLSGKGCRICGIKKRADKQRLTTEEFIEKSNNVHGEGTYDYSKVEYVDSHTNVIIICPKHGDFKLSPNNHLNGQGCQKCKNNYKGEIAIRKFLTEKGIEFEEQKRFSDCRDKRPLPFDFYLLKYNLCIEFDGIQHFKPNAFYSKNATKEEKLKNLEYIQNHDKIKNEYCKNEGIILLRFNNLKTVEKELMEYFKKQNFQVIIN